MKATLLRLLAFLAADLRQTDLEVLDKASLHALAAQFLHWSVACDEAAKRPTRRAQTAGPVARHPRTAGTATPPAFTLSARPAA